MKKRAIILLSGGLDSLTISAIAKNEGYELYGLSFNYGQRHKVELEMAKKKLPKSIILLIIKLLILI